MIIVPIAALAEARAQRSVSQLTRKQRDKGKNVCFCHPSRRGTSSGMLGNQNAVDRYKFLSFTRLHLEMIPLLPPSWVVPSSRAMVPEARKERPRLVIGK